jgi:mono/diheme cytochrome c family protein
VTAPPPIAGGTLLVASDGRIVAADADRDRLFLVELGARVVTTVVLQTGDEPGRVVEDDGKRLHVVLRGAGAIVTVDATSSTVVARRQVCPAPRGLAFDPERRRLLVACEGGELVALPSDPSAADPTSSLVARLDRDLRDVVSSRGRLFVSRFRSAEVLELSPTGELIARSKPSAGSSAERPMLATRMIAPASSDPAPDPIVVHSIATNPSPPPSNAPTREPSYQGGGTQGGGGGDLNRCSPGMGPVVITALTRPGLAGRTLRAPDHAVLPVDVAADESTIAIVAAGNGHTAALPQIYTFSALLQAAGVAPAGLPTQCAQLGGSYSVTGQAVAVAFRRSNALVVQSREPATIELLPEHVVIPLSEESREDTGHAIFHANSGAGVACASCHAEGGEDGQIWNLDDNGPSRTLSLRGTLAGTAPFHWRGDVPDIAALAKTVMTGRMNGPLLDDEQNGAFEHWLFALPAPRVAKPDEAAMRGQVLFESAAVGCSSCHSGPRLTSALTVDVGTGGSFQVPSLVGVSARAPFMHNGCAATLRDRFGTCGGQRHGNTSQLTELEIGDLVSYLSTL